MSGWHSMAVIITMDPTELYLALLSPLSGPFPEKHLSLRANTMTKAICAKEWIKKGLMKWD